MAGRGWLGALAIVVTAGVVSTAAAPALAVKEWGGVRVTIPGTRGDDVINGTRRFDVIRAGGGNDLVVGAEGDDFVCGGPGNDTLEGDDGADILRGGAGDDRFDAGQGNDLLRGQGGSDSGDAGPGIDACYLERFEGCDSDNAVDPFPSFYPPLIGGDNRVQAARFRVIEYGPTAPAPFAVITLPPEASFVPDPLDQTCGQDGPGTVTCAAGQQQFGVSPGFPSVRFTVDLRFPNCPPPGGATVTFHQRVGAPGLADPVPDNDEADISAYVNPAPTCP